MRKKVVVWAVVLFATMLGLDFALGLISSRSDLKVVCGVLIVIGIAAVYVPVIRKLWRRAANALNSHCVLAATVIAGAAVLDGCTVVDPGYVGVKINLFGSAKGVEEIPQVTGMVMYNPVSTRVFQYPTFVQTAIWTRDETEGSPTNEEITFNTKEGLVITADISLSHQLVPEKVPHFYVKFRTDDIAAYTHGFLRNVARDAFNEIGPRYGVEQVYGEGKEEFLRLVRDGVNAQIAPFGDRLEQFGFIGALRLPQNVVAALNAKIEATQNAIRAENELRQAEAEARKKVAFAEGEANSNKILTASITPELIRYRQLQILEAAVAKWDGRRPMVEGSGSGLLLSLNSAAFDARSQTEQK